MTADAGRDRGAAPAEFARGVGVFFDGIRLLRRERRLWPLSTVPLLFAAVALGVAGVLLYHNAGAIDGSIEGWLPDPQASAWYAWLWVGPAKLLLYLVDKLIWLVVLALSAVLALMVANVAAAPFLDALAYKVERIAAGAVVESDESGAGAFVRDVARSMTGEARRLLFFVSIWVVLFGAGLIVPGAHIITGPAMIAITILFLPLEYAGYTLDRRQVSFAVRRRWVTDRWPHRFGFGAAAFVACIIPGVNLLMIPCLVVAGTLLVVDDPPPATETLRG